MILQVEQSKTEYEVLMECSIICQWRCSLYNSIGVVCLNLKHIEKCPACLLSEEFKERARNIKYENT
jgi:hypothetical protein